MRSSLSEKFKGLISPFRLNISIAVLPVFLWGYALTEADITEKFLYGALILHLLIYPAINGLYIYFERRKKADLRIWGAKQPSLFIFVVSLILLVVGIYLSQRVNASYSNVLIILSILLFLYLYPETGIKSRPFYGILFISISYGLLGFLAGWVCASDLKGLFMDIFNIAGAIASIGFVSGFYTLLHRLDLFLDFIRFRLFIKFLKIPLKQEIYLLRNLVRGKLLNL